MKNILIASLAVLLLTVGALPVFATSETSSDVAITEEEQEKTEEVAQEKPEEVAQENPSVSQISEEDMKKAKLAKEGAITIEIAKEEEEIESWQKYLFLDVNQDLNDNQQTLWTRVGTRKGSFDFSVGWSQRFNEPETEPKDKGMVSMSASYWW